LSVPATPDDPLEWIIAWLGDPSCLWSMGGFGVSGIFPPGDHSVDITSDARAIVARSRNASLRIDRAVRLRLVAFETISSDPFLWNHGVALCFAKGAGMPDGQAGTIREIGPDHSAIDPANGADGCFDMGVGSRQARLLIRCGKVRIPSLLERLAGRSFLDLHAGAADFLAAGQLEWIVETPIGRVEMRQGEGMPCPVFIDRRLLDSGLTHTRGIVVPHGWLPCGYVFPPHPARAAPGVHKSFDKEEHMRFQTVLGRFGDPGLMRLKRQVVAALEAGSTELPKLSSRHEIDVARVALRQRLMTHPGSDLTPWLQAFDRPLMEAVAARTP